MFKYGIFRKKVRLVTVVPWEFQNKGTSSCSLVFGSYSRPLNRHISIPCFVITLILATQSFKSKLFIYFDTFLHTDFSGIDCNASKRCIISRRD